MLTPDCRERSGRAGLDSQDPAAGSLWHAPVGIARIDKDGLILSTNAYLCDLLGKPHDELIGRNLQDLLHPRERETYAARLAEIARGRKALTAEACFLRANGSPIWTINSFGRVPEIGAQSDHLIAIVQPNPARDAMEDALRESQEHSRYSVELSPPIPWTADPDGMLLEVGEHWLALFGVAPAQTTGVDWGLPLHPEDTSMAARDWAHSLRTGAPYDVDYRVRLTSGAYRWFRSRAVARLDGSGAIERWYGTLEDIHDRKSIEVRLRESEELSRGILEASPDCIEIISLDGRIRYMNPQGLRDMEFDDRDAWAAAFEGKSWAALFSAEHEPAATAAIEAALTGRATRFTAYMETAKATPKWWDITVNPLFDPDGRPVKLLAISRDVTAMTQAHAETERARAEAAAASARLQSVLDSTTDCVVVYDRAWHVTYINRHAQMTLQAPQFTVGCSLLEAFPGVLDRPFGTLMKQAMAERVPVVFETYAPEIDTWLEFRVFPAPEGVSVFFRDVTARRMAEEERRRTADRLAHSALHDALTGLPNRVQLRERLEQALAGAGEHAKMAVLCLDLDGFKPVNDRLGHAAGDAVLVEVARRLQGCVREGDTIARYGGDEFTAVLVGLRSSDDATGLAQRFVIAIEAPYEFDLHVVRISTCVGVAIAIPDVSLDTLLNHADIALYRAKAHGPGSVCLFDPCMASVPRRA